MSRSRFFFWLGVALVLVVVIGGLVYAMRPAPSPLPPPTPERPTPRPTFPRPIVGSPVPVTSADDEVIASETGPLYVMLTTVDDHGLPAGAYVPVSQVPNDTEVPTRADAESGWPRGTLAQVLEIRRLPPDYLRSFYRVTTGTETAWVSDFYAQRTVFVIALDEQRCACPTPVPLWEDEALTQPAGEVTNVSPVQVFAVGERAVQVQVLSNGTVGWLDRALIHESSAKEFIRWLARP